LAITKICWNAKKHFSKVLGTVLTAPCGDEGLKLASRHAVDVVILDYFLPKMNGQEVALGIRQLKPQASIIMLSGAVDVPEAALNWVDAFLPKDRLASRLLPTIAQLQVA
jgi:DNA-binding response OmpR family regulator